MSNPKNEHTSATAKMQHPEPLPLERFAFRLSVTWIKEKMYSS